ncbi:helicase associated domain-containing protein [Kitasatospora sp. NPDC085895]
MQRADGSVEEHALGAWVNNVRARRAKLSTEQVAQLEALGVSW